MSNSRNARNAQHCEFFFSFHYPIPKIETAIKAKSCKTPSTQTHRKIHPLQKKTQGYTYLFLFNSFTLSIFRLLLIRLRFLSFFSVPPRTSSVSIYPSHSALVKPRWVLGSDRTQNGWGFSILSRYSCRLKVKKERSWEASLNWSETLCGNWIGEWWK